MQRLFKPSVPTNGTRGAYAEVSQADHDVELSVYSAAAEREGQAAGYV